MTHEPAKIKQLAREYPQLERDKVNKSLAGLERMANFYASKAEIAPRNQEMLFRSFIVTLNYAMTVITLHRKLTNDLHNTAKGIDDE